MRRHRPRRDARTRTTLISAAADTMPAARYQTAPVGPAPRTHQGTYGEWTGTMTVNDAPASAADHIDDRHRKARACIDLKVAYLESEGMGYRIDDAEQTRQKGEKLDGRSVIARAGREAAAHLLGPREDWLTRNVDEPWEPEGGWNHGWYSVPRGPQTWPSPEYPPYGPADIPGPAYRPRDPSGIRAAYDRAFGGNGAA